MFKGTTVIALKKDGHIVMAGDGQVTFGDSIIKGKAKKIRRIFNDKVLLGFAGSTADAFTLFERFEAKLEAFSGNLKRAAVELAKDWRTDKILRHLEAMLLVADLENFFLITGSGDVLEPDEQVIAIGSGGNYARSAALALLDHSNLSAREIAQESMKIAARICIYTNTEIYLEELS
ncbi:MAG: ATP-dependent protease subunit HslV [Candidatus Wallbacteria bacterium]|nr:ATP-dependent protease subunit HslV [Candidatus Wallbacteria bacterium]